MSRAIVVRMSFPEEATDSEIAEAEASIARELDNLYRSMGGSGLRVLVETPAAPEGSIAAESEALARQRRDGGEPT